MAAAIRNMLLLTIVLGLSAFAAAQAASTPAPAAPKAPDHYCSIIPKSPQDWDRAKYEPSKLEMPIAIKMKVGNKEEYCELPLSDQQGQRIFLLKNKGTGKFEKVQNCLNDITEVIGTPVVSGASVQPPPSGTQTLTSSGPVNVRIEGLEQLNANILALREELNNRPAAPAAQPATATADARATFVGFGGQQQQGTAQCSKASVGLKVKWEGTKYECRVNPLTGETAWTSDGGRHWYSFLKSGQFWFGVAVGAALDEGISAAMGRRSGGHNSGGGSTPAPTGMPGPVNPPNGDGGGSHNCHWDGC